MNLKKIINKETFLYIVFGGLTTLVSIVTYMLFRLCLSVELAQVLSWICAVTFAYVTNKIFVFESKVSGFSKLLKEILLFFAARIATGVLEFGAMIVLVKPDTTRFVELIVKVFVTGVVIVLNYVLSKIFVFAKKKPAINSNDIKPEEGQSEEDSSLQ